MLESRPVAARAIFVRAFFCAAGAAGDIGLPPAAAAFDLPPRGWYPISSESVSILFPRSLLMRKCATLGAVMMFCLTLGLSAQAELKVGDAAPEFELVGSDGKTYKLEDFRGKSAVVLAWFPKAFTGG